MYEVSVKELRFPNQYQDSSHREVVDPNLTTLRVSISYNLTSPPHCIAEEEALHQEFQTTTLIME
jgi:hypothetical protein